MGRRARQRGVAPERHAADSAGQAEAEAKLDELYAELPGVKCQGHCAQACLSIDMTKVERRRLRASGAPEVPPLKVGSREPCPILKAGRCTAHPVRPMICRLWGASENTRCPYGCEVEGTELTHAQFDAYLIRSYIIGGWPAGAPRLSAKRIQEVLHEGPRVAPTTAADQGAGKRRLLGRLRKAG